MRERFYSDPRIGQSKNTALEIVTRNRAHFSRELRAFFTLLFERNANN